jgi:hypothetical protein
VDARLTTLLGKRKRKIVVKPKEENTGWSRAESSKEGFGLKRVFFNDDNDNDLYI